MTTATNRTEVNTAVLDGGPALEVDRVAVRFGGLVAVDDVSLVANPGTITGLIGPNGAGKTTTFNACTGLVQPATGEIRFGGRQIGRLSPSRRAQHGLGRTFQRMELWDTMTVRENVQLGREAILGGRKPWGQLWGSAAERADVRDRADRAMERCAIGDLGDATAGDLSTGQARLVELARALASGFSFLLLDEPSSGLDPSESEDFARILLDVAHQDGVGILLVEHDMTLVRACCSYIYVLEFGQLIHEGEADAVLASDVVKDAYLGSEAE